MTNPDLRGTRRKRFRIGGVTFDATQVTEPRVVTLPDSDVTLGGGGGGSSDHGTLSGLADDDHAQYHNDARGDARYSLLAHNHSGVYDVAGAAAAAQAASAPVAHVGAGGPAHANAIAAGAAGFMTGADKTKLDGIATGATANAADATLLARANHTGTQAASTISDFDSATRAQVEAELAAGANITITPSGSGATRVLTIASTGGGGGGGVSLPVAMAVASLRV